MRPAGSVDALQEDSRLGRPALTTTAIAQSTPRARWLAAEQEAEWDAFVSSHPLGLVYHLSAWRRVLEEAFPHIRGQFLVLRDGEKGRIQAGLPVYTVKSWVLGNRVTSIPFASFSDPLISSAEEFRRLLPELESLHRRSRSRRLEVRANKLAALLMESSLAQASNYKHHYLSLEKGSEELLSTFAKSSIRQKMSKASKERVTVVEREDEGGLEICHSILEETRARLALPVMPYTFFQAMRRWLWPKHLKVFVAMQREKPVGFHLVLKFKELWISEYSGDSSQAVSGVNQLLYWETMKRAQAQGATCFSFGRTASSNEGLLAYKRRWKPVEEDMADFSLPILDEAKEPERKSSTREQSAAYKMVRLVLAKAPKPVYRMIGDYCYRHLG